MIAPFVDRLHQLQETYITLAQTNCVGGTYSIFGIAGRVNAAPNEQCWQFLPQTLSHESYLIRLVRPDAEAHHCAVAADVDQLRVFRFRDIASIVMFRESLPGLAHEVLVRCYWFYSRFLTNYRVASIYSKFARW